MVRNRTAIRLVLRKLSATAWQIAVPHIPAAKDQQTQKRMLS